MEDEKLAAYYDDLTRRGGGAARFKQGLGFSSVDSPSDDVVPASGSALPSASSFFGGFVRASTPSKASEFEKQAQLQSIQNKLSKNPKEKTRNPSPRRNSSHPKRSRSPIRDKHSRRRSRSRDRYSRRKSRSRSRDRRSRRRRSRSREDESSRKYRPRSRSRDGSKRKWSPEKERSDRGKKVRGGSGIDYSKLIEGYDSMTPAERVKAKMKAQLSKTAEKDETIGKGSGWERFDFDKDAPLDDEEIEAAEDDAVLVKHMGQSFRYSAVEARREVDLKAAHDEAMFGGSSHPLPDVTNDKAQDESPKTENVESVPVKSLLSDKVQTMQRGSWRDRARKS